jgi:tetratricopeptide (TPR) repeat protein
MTLYHAILDNGVDAALKQYEAGPRLSEDDMNSMGLRLLRTKRYKEAIPTLELNVAAFPKSANAWDSLAGAYMRGGRELAIADYRNIA